MAVARMRLPCLPVFLIAALFISCANHDKRANTNTAPPVSGQAGNQHPCVNLNTATIEELMELPGIGEAMGRRIIEYRERHGPFRRPEEIIIIEGFSERKYRPLIGRICVE
ncbi:MAG TPA: helix-hairpin-helix domain-containing protein [Blastocatellia bacterium]|jgi:competence protein ComEA